MRSPLPRLRRWAPWLVTAAATVAAVSLVATRPAELPAFEAVRAAHVPSDAWLLDRHGQQIDTRRIDPGVRRLEWASLDEVSPALLDAIVSGEDRRFWRHRGVDWFGLAAAFSDAAQGRPRGASTITMQVVGMPLGTAAATKPQHTRDLAAKIRQMRLAQQLERQWSKRQILETYLNSLQFRGELQGVRAASLVLAGKAPAGLTREEAQVLAALLPQPRARPARVAARACARVVDADCASLRATAERLLATRHVVAAERLAPQLAVNLLHRPGERVRTTLDAGLQRVAHEALARRLEGLSGRNVRDGAALVVDNRTGEVLAYVGSAGGASTAAAVDGVRARRQAGSTLKPFLYELALERRYLTTASLLDDSPVAIDTASGIYLPKDYDHQYRGPVSVRTALAGSLNVPAVRTLMLVGVEPFRDRLQQLGYAGVDRDGAYYGFALALGSAEVSLWEQAQAYRTLALGGMNSALRVRAEDAEPQATRVLPAASAFIATDVLSDRGARAVTFGLDSSLATPYWSAVKTGTSKDMRDNWCVGFSRDYTVAVWVGNFEGDSMHDVSGVSGAAPAWRDIMDVLHSEGAATAPAAPEGVVRQPLRFAGNVEPPRSEWYLEGTTPGQVVRPVDARTQIVRISSPVNGMVIALDPDIPAAAQRVPISVEGAGLGHRLALDGTPLGKAQQQILWQPTPGRHRLALADAAGRVIDRLHFTVR